MLSVGMIQLRSMIRQFIRNEEAATMVEYALMLALIAIVCIAAVEIIGTSARDVFTGAGTALQNTAPAAP